MASSKKSNGLSPLTIFILLSLLVTPPLTWLYVLINVVPGQKQRFIIETFKRPITYLWLTYASVVAWLLIKTYGR